MGTQIYPSKYTAAKSLQSCRTLCDPIDGSPTGSPVPGILQARTLEWVAVAFSNAWKWKVKVKSLSRVWLLATPWTAGLPGSSIHGIFQTRVLAVGCHCLLQKEMGAIGFFLSLPTCIWPVHLYTIIFKASKGNIPIFLEQWFSNFCLLQNN